MLWTELLVNGIRSPFIFAFYTQKKNDYNRKAAKLWKQLQIIKVAVITTDEKPYHRYHRWSFYATEQ